MSECGIDTSKFFGDSVSFGGSSIPPEGQPPPLIKISENIDKAGCSGGSRVISIDISGELVCCDPQESINNADYLIDAFSESCGDISAGGYSYKGARVSSFDVSSSSFVGKVPYSASLTWTDPDYGDGAVTDRVNSIQSSQNDETVTITHTVSARGSTSMEDCNACNCSMSEVEEWVSSNISEDSAPPSPQTLKLPNNPEATGSDCPVVTERRDDNTCFFEITKVWTIQRNLNLTSSSYGADIKVSKCTETSEDENGKQTITISGNISFEGSSACEEDCDGASEKVKSAMEAEKSAAIASRSGRKASVSYSFSDGSSPSANYTVTFSPEPDNSDEEVKDSFSVSVSFGTDGVGTVTVNGSVTANQQKAKTVSENCLCEIVDANFKGEGAAKGNAVEYYNAVKEKLGDALQKLQGPCAEQNQLGANPESSDEGDCEGGSKSYSYSWTDKDEKDAQWNYSVNVTRPVEKVSIQNTIGGGYCVTRTGQYEDGTVSVSGSRSQNCPDDPDFNTDAIALELAQAYSGSNDLKVGEDCNKTVTGNQEENTFDKSFTFEQGGGVGGPRPPILNNQRAAGRGKFN